MGERTVKGLTFIVHAPDFARAVEFYEGLFARPADFSPHDDFREWEITRDAWLLLGAGDAIPSGPIRLRVDDVVSERERVCRDLHVSPTPIDRIEGLVALCDFSDPWGNKLGLYQRLYAAEPRKPGGSHLDRTTWTA